MGKYGLKYLIIVSATLLFSGCSVLTTIIDTLSPVPTSPCLNYGSLPRYPLNEEARWLCRSIVARGAVLHYEKDAIRIVFPDTNNFKKRSSITNEELELNLDAVAAVMEQYRALHALIVGYTNESDTKANDAGLAFRRAESVAAYLISQGVSTDKLAIEASNEPVAPGLTGRRVEIIIFKGTYVRNIYSI